MDQFNYRHGQLFAEDCPVDALLRQFGSPLYIYSEQTLVDHYRSLAGAFQSLNPLLCYSIKSCANIHLVQLLRDEGAGMDIVSGGELFRAMQAGVEPGKIVYAGVGKTDAEITAALQAGIAYFNVESAAELEAIAHLAEAQNTTASIAVRVNPDVDPHTHAKTTTGKKETKFGIDIERATELFRRYASHGHVKVDAIHVHLGSPIYTVDPYAKALDKVMELIESLRSENITIRAINFGGGFGADYISDQSPHYQDYAQQIVDRLQPFVDGGGRVILEPGRTIAANAGVLACSVLYRKAAGSKTYVIVDTGMHHLIRPAMYDSFHFIWPTAVRENQQPAHRKQHMDLPDLETVEIAGPICESSDILSKGWAMPHVERGEHLAIFSAGAYGMTMASQYNAMVRPAEVLVRGETARLIRRRETYEDLIAHELELSEHFEPLPQVTEASTNGSPQ